MSTFNGASYIREQLDSILAQTYQDIELVCVDDVSTDSTFAILTEYQILYPEKVRIFQNSKNVGSRKTFERGVLLAAGRYIAFSDQDDFWLPGKLRVLFDEIQKDQNLAFVYSNSELVDENLKTLKARTWEETASLFTGNSFYGVLNDNTIMGCSMLADAAFAKACAPFPATGLHHDWYLAVMALGCNRPILFVNQVLFKYRRHSKNQVNRMRKKGSTNTTRFRALRTFKETALLDTRKLTNQSFRDLIIFKREMFRSILNHRPLEAFKNWKDLYSLLDTVHAVNSKVKWSNFRYIIYGLFWRKPSEQELA